MADVNPAPNPEPVLAVGHPPDLCIFCLRDWSQDQAARAVLSPSDYSTYIQITWNYYNLVTPYDQFQIQLKTLIERPDREYGHLQPYWTLFHREYIERMPVEDDPLFFYPIVLCRELNRIPGFDFFADPEQSIRIREHNLREAERINSQMRAAFELRSKPRRRPHRKRNAQNLEQAPLEGAADIQVETQADTPKRRPYRKRKAQNIEQAPLEGATENQVETQTDTPKRRSHRKRKAQNLEQALPRRRN